MTRIPSRYMPTYEEISTQKSQWIAYSFLILSTGSIGYLIWYEPWLGFFIVLAIFAVHILSLISPDSEYELNIEKLAKQRKNEDIGTFTRSLDYRNIDTWIIRSTYEEISHELGFRNKSLPIRISDDLEKDLELDDEDLFYIYNRIVARVGISNKETEKNPYYGKVETVKDLILFLNAQPKLA